MRSDHLTKHQRTHRKLMMLATGSVLENSDLDGAGCLEDSHDNIKDERFSARSVHLADDFTPVVNNPGINGDT